MFFCNGSQLLFSRATVICAKKVAEVCMIGMLLREMLCGIVVPCMRVAWESFQDQVLLYSSIREYG